jgi:hypothetical protein
LLTEATHKDVHRILLENASKNGHGGDRRSETAKKNQGDAHPLGFSRHGNKQTRAVLSVRLAQEHPKVRLHGNNILTTRGCRGFGGLVQRSGPLARSSSLASWGWNNSQCADARAVYRAMRSSLPGRV